MGYERTNIVFYNDVRVSDHYRVGDVDGGLRVMRVALEAEQKHRARVTYRTALSRRTLNGRRRPPAPKACP